MMKKIRRFFLLLVMIIICILLLQWKEYSSKDASDLPGIHQTIKLTHLDQTLHVIQTIHNLPPGHFHIHSPAQAENLTCQNQDREKCNWTRNNQFINNDEQTIIFTYDLKVPKQSSDFMLDEWAVEIKEFQTHFTRIQLTEKQPDKGSWAASAELAGKERMDAIDYYVFESADRIPFLLWTTEELVYQKQNHRLAIYSSDPEMIEEEVFEKLVPDENVYMVITGHISKLTQHGNLILVPASKKGVEQTVRLLLEEQLAFREDIQWLTDLAGSLLAGYETQNNQLESMRETLVDTLTEEQLNRWLNHILAEKEEVTPEMLDAWLWETANISTDFFQQNASLQSPIYSLYTFDGREVYIGGKKAGDIKILQQNNRTYISFFPLTERLGYRTLKPAGNKEIRIEKDGNTYHFTFEKKVFTLNGRQYGFQHNPFLIQQESVFLDMAALPDLFELQVAENEKKILIQ
ncbi:stalk domain-containing protein [Siminovitchia sediminis]|uniref:Stalk domain-containing protein n=1 Tax=Siminovitchia sediminis TaxID=1274353 RepID=A0ABW4KFD7_9BACI